MPRYQPKGDTVKRLATVAMGAGCLGVVGVSTLLVPAIASAAGSGYTPAASPTTGGTASGLAGTVVSSTTIQPSGGTATGTVGTATISVDVPAGDFPNPVQAVLTNASGSSVTPASGGTVVATFGIGFYENGTKVTGTFPAVTVTVTSPSITAGSTVYLVEGTTLVAASGASVKAGSATFTITSDPTVEIVAPVATTAAAAASTSATPISGATTAETGKPFLLEEGIAGALVAFGAALFVGLRLRRRSA